MKVNITKEWLAAIPLEDDLMDPAAGAFRFEPWSVTEPDPEPAQDKLGQLSPERDASALTGCSAPQRSTPRKP